MKMAKLTLVKLSTRSYFFFYCQLQPPIVAGIFFFLWIIRGGESCNKVAKRIISQITVGHKFKCNKVFVPTKLPPPSDRQLQHWPVFKSKSKLVHSTCRPSAAEMQYLSALPTCCQSRILARTVPFWPGQQVARRRPAKLTAIAKALDMHRMSPARDFPNP